jgi:CDP-diacylglycerol--glycerol-3-phosphate 3-phosphatidyltransferase
MLNRYARALITRILTPVARALVALGISPDVVTLVGTLGVIAGAMAFYPRGSFFVGTLVVTVFVFSDTLDGIMARMTGRASSWGAFLDSTLDRIGDAAVFGGLVLYFAGRGDDVVMAGLALACLVFGQVVSYARARAEGLGMTANVGIAERADRLVTVLLTTGLTGLFGLPVVVLEVVLALLAVASLVTIAQRMLTVRRQVLEQQRAAGGPPHPGGSGGPGGPGEPSGPQVPDGPVAPAGLAEPNGQAGAGGPAVPGPVDAGGGAPVSAWSAWGKRPSRTGGRAASRLRRGADA